MDQTSFDRLARLLGGGATRRQGLAAALAGALGLAGSVPAGVAVAVATVAAAPEEEGNPGDEAKCLKGKAAKKKRCRKHAQCCTGYCKKIRKRKNGKVRKTRRCRCAPEGFKCGAKTKCCGAMTCATGKCAPPTPTPPTPGNPVATGAACVAGVDTCANPAATCAAYEGGNPAGTHCVLPVTSACTAAGDCITNTCLSGACAARLICMVCSSGCKYPTVQAAITALETAATMQTVTIAAGEYIEDLGLSGKITLAACGDGPVTLRNANPDIRTIYFNAQYAELVLTDITVSAKQPPDTGRGGGGLDISNDSKLTLNGTTSITGNIAAGGGGIRTTGGAQIVMNDTSSITGNKSGHSSRGGGGVFLESNTTIVMNDDSSITNNEEYGGSPGGGGIHCGGGGAIITMNDRSKITGNKTTADGGGVHLDSDASLVINSQDVRITGNDAGDEGGGGYQRTGSSAPAGVNPTVFNTNTAVTCANYWLKDSGGSCFLT